MKGKDSSSTSCNNSALPSEIVLPPHWYLKQSRSKQRRIYYANNVLKSVSWDFPQFTSCPEKCVECEKYKLKLNKKKLKDKLDNTKLNEPIDSKFITDINCPESMKSVNTTQIISSNSPSEAKFINTFNDLNPDINCSISECSSKKCDGSHSENKIYFSEQKIYDKPNLSRKRPAEFSDDNFVNPKKMAVTTTTRWDIKTKCISKCKVSHRKRTLRNGSFSKWDKLPPGTSLDQKNTNNEISKLTEVSSVKSKIEKPTDLGSTEVTITNDRSVKELDNRSSANVVTADVDNKTAAKCDDTHKPEIESTTIKCPSASSSTTASKSSSNDKLNTNKRHKLVGRRKNVMPICTKSSGNNKQSSIHETNNSDHISFPSTKKETDEHYIHLSSFEPETNSQDNDYTDAMEVDIVTELQNIRKLSTTTSFTVDEVSPSFLEDQNVIDSRLFIVIDTNILIRRLSLVHRLSHYKPLYKGCTTCVVVVPYTVLLELDGLKNRATVENSARAAIRWCNTAFSAPNSNVLGQSYQNYNHLHTTKHGSTGDDRIKDWCQFLQEERNLRTLLLTDDVNFNSKAAMTHISVLTSETLARDLHQTTPITNNQNRTSTPINTFSDDETAVGAKRKKSRYNQFILNATKQSDRTDRWEPSIVDSPVNRPNKTLFRSREFRCQKIKSENRFSDDHMEIVSIPDDSAQYILSSTGTTTDDVTNSSGSIYVTASDHNVSISSDISKRSNTSGCCNTSTVPSGDILLSLEKTLGNILKYVMEKEFDKLWLSMILHKPPWTFRQIFACYKKHWLAVFMDKFPSSMQKEIKGLEIMCSSSSHNLDSLLLKQKCLYLYSYFKKQPYCSFIEHFADKKQTTLNSSENVTSPSDKTNVHNLNNTTSDCASEPRVHISMKVNPPFAKEFNNSAQSVIIATGSRMREFVSAGVAADMSGNAEQHFSVLQSLIALRRCVLSLAFAITRNESVDYEPSTKYLRDSIIDFWTNANEGADHKRYVTSDEGASELQLFSQSADGCQFLSNCALELRTMRTDLDNRLSAYGINEEEM